MVSSPPVMAIIYDGADLLFLNSEVDSRPSHVYSEPWWDDDLFSPCWRLNREGSSIHARGNPREPN